MTTVAPRQLSPIAPLAPISATLRAAFGHNFPLPGLLPDLLTAGHPAGWTRATELTGGTALPELLDAARRIWQAQPHAAAALAWKNYTYWLALPAVVGWAGARRVPLLRPEDVLVRIGTHEPLVTIGLHPTIEVAVLPTDPLAAAGLPGIRVAADETDLLALVRASLLDAHLTPMLDAIRGHARLGARTLLGSLASAVARGVLRTADALPGRTVDNVDVLLDALGVADLAEIVTAPDGRLSVQRKTCCLAFTLPTPKVCAGCCIKQ